MVLEIAIIDVVDGSQEKFVAGYHEGRKLIAASPGSGSITMRQCIETPTRFVLTIEWDSVQAHEDFRAGEAFPAWRAFVGPHFAEKPRVEHFQEV